MSGLYRALIDFVENKNDAFWVREADVTDTVKITRVNDKNRKKSLVYLNFDLSDYVSLFQSDDNENHSSHLIDIAFGQSGYYGGYVFLDSYYDEYEWNEGYILRSFSDENIQKLKEILAIISRPLSNFTFNDDNKVSKIAKFLSDNFSNEVDYIMSEYTELYDDTLVKGLKTYVQYKLCDVLFKFGIYEKNCGTKYFTTVGVLLDLWKKTDSSDEDSITDVLEKFIKQNDLEFDEDLYEDYYAYYDYQNWDGETFNRTVERMLNKIKDKVEDDLDLEKFQETQKIYEFLDSQKINISKTNQFPKQKTFGEKNRNTYVIRDVKDGILHIRFGEYDGNQPNYSDLSMNLEEFKNFLFHPELFT